MKIKSKIKDKEKDKFEQLSKKFKTKFHKNMSIEELSVAWSLVPPEISSKVPEVGIALEAINNLFVIVKTIRKAQVVAHEIYIQSQSALEDASAIMTQQYQVPVTKAAKEAAKVAAEQVAEQLKQQAVTLMGGLLPVDKFEDEYE